MPVETDADRALFLDDFGVPVTWVHAGGTAMLTGIFDEEYQLLTSPLADVGVEGAAPHFLARAADVPGAGAHGDAVTIGAATYTIVEIRPDGTGFTVVRLQEA